MGLLLSTSFLLTKYWDLIEVESRRYNFDPLLVAAVIYVESRFDRTACHKGAHGLMQIQLRPRSCRRSRRKARVQGLYNPRVNIRRGLKLMAWWRDWWKKHPRRRRFHWLLFYNQGYGRCPRSTPRCPARKRIPVTTGRIGSYARKVMRAYRRFQRTWSI